MSLARFNSASFSVASGVAVAPSSVVEVRRESDSALASLFSDRAGAVAISNPLTADSEGRFDFCVAASPGGFSIEVTFGAESFTLRNVPIGTAQELDADPFWATVWAAATKLAARIALKAMGLDGLTSRATNTILAAADSGGAFVATGDFTQTLTAAATLGADWHVHYRVNAGQTVTLDPDGAELIDGAATKVVVGPASGVIVCDGSAFFTYGFDGPAASDAVPGRVELATQAEQETGTDVTRAVTPGRQHFHPSAAKAWVHFNGAGTVAINGSYNVTSITDNNTGDYNINWATDFSNDDYSVSLSAGAGPAGTIGLVASQANEGIAVGLIGVIVRRSDTDALVDPVNFWATAFGDHA